MRRSSMVRHLHAAPTVTDPETGRTYPIPAGGADGPADAGDDDADDDGGDDGGSDDVDDDGEDDADADADDKLGPAGEKALREMKKRARAAERELRRLKAQQGNDGKDADGDTPDPEELRQQIEAEVRAEASRDRALDKLEAKAARKFKNPDLARKLLADQADDFLDDKGNPDVEAINEALDELLDDEPYLALDAQGDRRFQGDADGGTRNGSDAGQLTREHLKTMTPEQIAVAKKEGRLDKLLGR